MLNSKAHLRRRITTLAIALVIAIGILAPKKASAAMAYVDCPITLVEYLENQLILRCSNSDFYAQSSAVTAGCVVKASDTLKFWQSLGTSLLLSGKQSRIWFDNAGCGSHMFIYAVDINQ